MRGAGWCPHSSKHSDVTLSNSNSDQRGYRSHFGSRYKLGCCGDAGLFALGGGSIPGAREITVMPNAAPFRAHALSAVIGVQTKTSQGHSTISPILGDSLGVNHFDVCDAFGACCKCTNIGHLVDMHQTSACTQQAPGRPGQRTTKQKADSTLRSSRAVPHPSTNRALRRLTSEVGRDPVHSTRYGRQRT